MTEKQRRIYDLVEGGKTQHAVAVELGLSLSVVRKTVRVARDKLGVVGAGPGAWRRVENVDPEKAAALLDAASEPEALARVRAAMSGAGLPESVSARMLHRIRVKYFGAVSELRALKTAEILDLLGKKIHLALSYMDDKVMAEASFRDLALGSTAMIEKRALLRGEPTQIISDHERKRLNELTPLLIAEAQRRGIVVEGVVLAKRVEAA